LEEETMLLNRRSVMVLFAVAVVSCMWLGNASAGEDAKGGGDGKSGTATGVVTSKGKDFIKVRSEGDREPKQYMPEWKGDASGGLDKEILEKIGSVPIGSVVKVTWKQDEHLRVTGIEVVKKGEGDHKDGEHREGRERRREGDRKDGEHHEERK
jgi:hypothetical protein